MSRFYYDNDVSESEANLWEANVRRALRGKRGQAALQELEASLMALPSKRLIDGYLCDGHDVCLVGAMALKRAIDAGVEPAEALDALPTWIDTEIDTAEYGQKNLGLTFTLAWHLAYVNDEYIWNVTPEKRYERALAWVRKQIATPPQRGAGEGEG